MEHRCKNLRDVQGYCCSFPKPNSANFSIWALSVFVLSLGHTDPGFDPDIICETDVESLTNLHMGFESLANLLKQNAIDVSGSNDVIHSMPNWIGTSHFAKASG